MEYYRLIFFSHSFIDDQTWIQSKAYKYGYSGENSLSRSEISNEDGEVKGILCMDFNLVCVV